MIDYCMFVKILKAFVMKGAFISLLELAAPLLVDGVVGSTWA